MQDYLRIQKNKPLPGTNPPRSIAGILLEHSTLCPYSASLQTVVTFSGFIPYGSDSLRIIDHVMTLFFVWKDFISVLRSRLEPPHFYFLGGSGDGADFFVGRRP